MINHMRGFARMRTLQVLVICIFAVLVGRLFYIQLIDPRYEELARTNTLRRVVQYATRGEVFDRNGEYLVQSRACYDLMVTYKDLKRTGFDTVRFCAITKITRAKLQRELANARMSPRVPYVVAKYLSKEDKLRFDECNFPGFYTVYRTIREYPRKIGGNLLGYVGEVNANIIKKNPAYRPGDYIGMSGVERSYERILKGHKGVKVQKVDTHGAVKDSYMDGRYDSLPEAGNYLVSTIDARLQRLGEELMRGKVGAAVAIDPATGEILMMVSSPTYDPDDLLGRERGNNYMRLLRDNRHPLFNRAVTAKYPPGSTFKLVQGLIGMQEGVLRPSDLHQCNMGYQAGKLKVGCHAHTSPLNLRYAVATSCNAYFCYVFRDILENPKYGSPKKDSTSGANTSRVSDSATDWARTSWTKVRGTFPIGRSTTGVTTGRGMRSPCCRFPSDKARWVAPLATGQSGLHRRQPRLLLHSAYRQEDRGTRFDRPPVLRTPVHQSRCETLRTDRRRHVEWRKRSRHLAIGRVARARCLRQDRYGPESQRARPFDVPRRSPRKTIRASPSQSMSNMADSVPRQHFPSQVCWKNTT